MTHVRLEHANVTVADARATAEELCRLFDWEIRWEGSAINGGHTVHVGNKDSYVAAYTPPSDTQKAQNSYVTRGGLNHLAVVVDDLEEIERRVSYAGYTPHNHADYEPGRRFYFHDNDGIEIEVVQYD